jgi:hypothetical protein
LLVLLPVPIVYPKIPISESLLSSLQGGMRNSKALRDALAKISGDSGAVNVFGEPDILDDLQVGGCAGARMCVRARARAGVCLCVWPCACVSGQACMMLYDSAGVSNVLSVRAFGMRCLSCDNDHGHFGGAWRGNSIGSM